MNQNQTSQPERIDLCDGKYSIINDNGNLTALRNGEPWSRDLTGDNLVYWAMVRIRDLEEELKVCCELKREYQERAAQPAPVAQKRTLIEQHDLDQSPEYRKGYEDGRHKGYEVGYRHGIEHAALRPVTQPLTVRQIAEATGEFGHVRSGHTIGIARAIERAHKIGGAK